MTVPPSPRSAARLHAAQTFRLPNIGANLAQQPRHRGLDQPQLAAELEFRLNGSLVLLLGVGGLRWGEAAALRVGDVDFLRRRISLHRNAVAVGSQVVVGTLKGNRSRSVVLPEFVIDAIAQTAAGKDRDELLWPATSGGYLQPPAPRSWLGSAVKRAGRRPDVPAGDRTPTAPHRGIAGNPRGGQPARRAADAGPRVRGDDAGRLRRLVRVRSGGRRRKSGQFVGTAGLIARPFYTENASTSGYAGRGVFVSVKKWFTGPVRQIGTVEPEPEPA
jgi:hypothetical protein